MDWNFLYWFPHNIQKICIIWLRFQQSSKSREWLQYFVKECKIDKYVKWPNHVFLFQGGGREVWKSERGLVITSLTFHPTEQLLVMATSNELLFWDWARSEPFAVCKTAYDYERIRYVSTIHTLLLCYSHGCYVCIVTHICSTLPL